MAFTIICENLKTNIFIEINGHSVPINKSKDGLFYYKCDLPIGNYYIKIVEDNILYHRKCYLQLINPIMFVRKAFFLKKFMYSDIFNSEADVIFLKVRINKLDAKIKFSLIPKRINQNYTEYRDLFEYSLCSGVTILQESHYKPSRQFIINYMILNYTPPILTIVIILYTILFRYGFDGEFVFSALVYILYATICIIIDVIKLRNKS